MIQKIYPWGVIFGPRFPPPDVIFSKKCSVVVLGLTESRKQIDCGILNFSKRKYVQKNCLRVQKHIFRPLITTGKLIKKLYLNFLMYWIRLLKISGLDVPIWIFS